MTFRKGGSISNLDNLPFIQNLDRDNILRNIQEFPEQVQRCWSDWQKMALPTSYIQAKSIVIAGMGGSAIGGALTQGLSKNAHIPIVTCNDYDPPGFINKDTLFIAVSYSGNTEETVSALKKAAQKTDKLITISTGGKIASLATNFRTPHYKIDYGSQPRAALGYTFISLVAILTKLNFIEIKNEEISETLVLLKGLQKKIDVNVQSAYNNAKILAQKIFGKIPIVYGSGYLSEVGRRWKEDFNENAKSASYFEVIPELNHNALVGLQFPQDLKAKIFVIILQSKFDHPRNTLRQNITAQILQKNRISYESVLMEPSASALDEILQAVHLGDYVSYYLAILNNVEPNPVEMIGFLKDKLAEQPIRDKRKKKK